MKYLFKATFQDGLEYQQNEQDVSVNNPERSCFFDLKQEEAKGNFPTRFSLSNGDKTYLVDLTDGHFEINGAHIDINDEEARGPFRLVYFRRHTHNFNDDKNNHWFTFNIGWQTTHNGVNIKRIITIKD